MSESVQLTAEVFIDTGKDFRPEDSLTVPYTCTLGETVTLDFDLTGFEHTCGFRFRPAAGGQQHGEAGGARPDL